jgi:hypothetical protein
MTAERRLDAIEGALSPTELVVAWLAEVHNCGTLDACVRTSLEEADYVPPINRLAHAAMDSARLRAKGKPREEIDKAANQAVRETLFRFPLVMRINTRDHDRLERQLLFTALFSARLGLLLYTPEEERARDRHFVRQYAELRDLVAMNARDFEMAGQAREAVERKYLAGHPALFPDDQQKWAEQLATNKAVETLVVKVAKDAAAPPAKAQDPETDAIALARHVDGLVEPAKVAAYEDLDEGRIAIGIATRWLRGKLDSVA